MPSKLAVVFVPFIISPLHFEVARRCIDSLLTCDRTFELEVINVVNHFEGSAEDLAQLKDLSTVFIDNDKNILARAWNVGIKTALDRGADYVLVSNLDILFHAQFLTNLIQFAKEEQESILWGGKDWSGPEPIESASFEGEKYDGVYFNCFLCDHRLFERVGEFDENFIPAYHEDMDMRYRIQLANLTSSSTPTAVYRHFDRMTLKCAASAGKTDFVIKINKALERSLAYYVSKWGGVPGAETFSTPFAKQA